MWVVSDERGIRGSAHHSRRDHKDGQIQCQPDTVPYLSPLPKMRSHLIWLLSLTLLGLPAQALRCHECKSGENCYSPTSCNNSSRYCMTIWHSHEMIVIKACAYTCPDAYENLPNYKTSCCNTDLCNSASSHLTSWGLLALSAWCICQIR